MVLYTFVRATKGIIYYCQGIIYYCHGPISLDFNGYLFVQKNLSTLNIKCNNAVQYIQWQILEQTIYGEYECLVLFLACMSPPAEKNRMTLGADYICVPVSSPDSGCLTTIWQMHPIRHL